MPKPPPSIYQVDPQRVQIEQPHPKDVEVQKARLIDEGQIEPIEVRPDLTLLPDGWFYAAAQVQAARELEWPTILVTY